MTLTNLPLMRDRFIGIAWANDLPHKNTRDNTLVKIDITQTTLTVLSFEPPSPQGTNPTP